MAIFAKKQEKIPVMKYTVACNFFVALLKKSFITESETEICICTLSLKSELK